MNKILLTAVLSALVFMYVGYIIGMSKAPVCTRKHQNFIDDGRMVIIPVKNVEGRPVYDVVIKDENVIRSLYAEEIGYGLATGNWQYDEDITLQCPDMHCTD